MNLRRLFRQTLLQMSNRYKTFLYADACVMGARTVLLHDAIIENLQDNRQSIQLGENNLIRGHLLVWKHGGQIRIGDDCFIGPRTAIWSMASITIGNRVLISHDVNIMDSNAHSKLAAERHQHFLHIAKHGHPRDARQLGTVASDPIVIEDDVWINFGCTLLRGVRIGARSIIAAGAIVTKDVPPDSICLSLHELQIRPIEHSHQTT